MALLYFICHTDTHIILEEATMFIERGLGQWVSKEYGRRWKDRVKKKVKADRGVFAEDFHGAPRTVELEYAPWSFTF